MQGDDRRSRGGFKLQVGLLAWAAIDRCCNFNRSLLIRAYLLQGRGRDLHTGLLRQTAVVLLFVFEDVEGLAELVVLSKCLVSSAAPRILGESRVVFHFAMFELVQIQILSF